MFYPVLKNFLSKIKTDYVRKIRSDPQNRNIDHNNVNEFLGLYFFKQKVFQLPDF